MTTTKYIVTIRVLGGGTLYIRGGGNMTSTRSDAYKFSSKRLAEDCIFRSTLFDTVAGLSPSVEAL